MNVICNLQKGPTGTHQLLPRSINSNCNQLSVHTCRGGQAPGEPLDCWGKDGSSSSRPCRHAWQSWPQRSLICAQELARPPPTTGPSASQGPPQGSKPPSLPSQLIPFGFDPKSWTPILGTPDLLLSPPVTGSGKPSWPQEQEEGLSGRHISRTSQKPGTEVGTEDLTA